MLLRFGDATFTSDGTEFLCGESDNLIHLRIQGIAQGFDPVGGKRINRPRTIDANGSPFYVNYRIFRCSYYWGIRISATDMGGCISDCMFNFLGNFSRSTSLKKDQSGG